jgi:hypothetical protein
LASKPFIRDDKIFKKALRLSRLKKGNQSLMALLTVCMLLSQMTTRSNAPASPPHPGLQPGLKNAEYMKLWDKSGYITVLTSSKLQWGEDNPPLKPRTC